MAVPTRSIDSTATMETGMGGIRSGLFVALAAASFAAVAAPVIFSASGSDPASIQGTVDTFRTTLGPLNPNAVGSAGSGRREINWDGVPDPRSAPNELPANFFNVNSPRGVVFSTPGTGFQVSGNSGVAAVRFDNITAGYSALFGTFSAQRLFTALGSTITDVHFFVPGTTTPAYVTGFGAVFTDVDLPGSASLAFFDPNDVLLDLFNVPVGSAGANQTLSFLGSIYTAGDRIGRVRISSGNQVLGGAETGDLVVMDDFIYSEPNALQAIPEPGSLALMAAALGLLWRYHRPQRPVTPERFSAAPTARCRPVGQ